MARRALKLNTTLSLSLEDTQIFYDAFMKAGSYLFFGIVVVVVAVADTHSVNIERFTVFRCSAFRRSHLQ